MSAFPLATLGEAGPMQRDRQSFSDFLDCYRSRLHEVFHARTTADRLNLERGLPTWVLGLVREVDPLTVYVPHEYGGRGNILSECLSMLETTG